MLFLRNPAARLGHFKVGSRTTARAPFSAISAVRSAFQRPQSPNGPVGVARALEASSISASGGAEPTLFSREFSLADRVALVTGGNRGIGLESALALIEAGARAVYCVDLPAQPGEEWTKIREYVTRMGERGRLEYVSGDVRDQELMWKVGETIGDREGRMDVCVAAAGIVNADIPFLERSAEQFQEVMEVNTNGVFYTAQAAGRQMERFGNGGSVIMIASICGSVSLEALYRNVAYGASKAAILQMACNMACELGSKGIRANTISPGFIRTKMTTFLDYDSVKFRWVVQNNPLGRIGRPEELRGVVAWLASDASSFCTGSDILVSGGHHAW